MGGGEQEAIHRCHLNNGVDNNIIVQIQEALHNNHPYVESFKYALQQLNNTPDYNIIIHADRRPTLEHKCRYNAPAVSEVAILMVGEEQGKRDIILRKRDHQLTRISETHRSHDCLQYPIMFQHGEDGYKIQIPQVNPSTGLETAKMVSCKDFYSYRFMVRPDEFNNLLRFKELTCQFMVDMYAKIESERLLYFRNNQRQLRADQ